MSGRVSLTPHSVKTVMASATRPPRGVRVPGGRGQGEVRRAGRGGRGQGWRAGGSGQGAGGRGVS